MNFKNHKQLNKEQYEIRCTRPQVAGELQGIDYNMKFVAPDLVMAIELKERYSINSLYQSVERVFPDR